MSVDLLKTWHRHINAQYVPSAARGLSVRSKQKMSAECYVRSAGRRGSVAPLLRAHQLESGCRVRTPPHYLYPSLSQWAPCTSEQSYKGWYLKSPPLKWDNPSTLVSSQLKLIMFTFQLDFPIWRLLLWWYPFFYYGNPGLSQSHYHSSDGGRKYWMLTIHPKRHIINRVL